MEGGPVPQPLHCVLSSENPLATFGEVLNRARQLLGAGDLAEAQRFYRQLVEAVPQAAEPWHELGILQLQAGRPEGALECLRQAVTLDPGSATYHVNLATTYRMLKRPDEAIESFERALKLGSPTAELYNNLALSLKDTGQTDAALRAFDDALRLRPQYANGHFNRGNLLLESGRLEEAAESYQRAIETQGDDAVAHCKLGMVDCDLGRWDQAVACFRRALELEPGFPEASSNLVAVLERQGRFAEAADCWRRVLELNPDSAEGHNSLGALLAMQGQTDQAAACWRRALELKPDFAEAYNNLGALLSDQNKLEEAAACCRRALELKPDFADAHGNLGGIFTRQEQLDEAVACYRRALELRPDFAEMHNNLGAILEKQGRFDEAAACCRRALELKPDFAEATSNLGILLAQQGMVAEAKECYLKALEFQPRHAVWRLSVLSLCPSVFGSNEDIEHYRRALLGEIEGFSGTELGLDFPALATTGCTPSFNLQYHGRDDRPIREAYARLFRNCFPTEIPAGSSGRARIGFVVTNRHEKAFLKSIGAVLERMDQDSFELVVVGSDRGMSMLRPAIRNPAIRLLGVPNRFDAFLDTIRAARCDLLYYWEVGTDSTNYFLPFFRLAPVQCTSWGIQNTSGIPQLDHYLSSALLEPEDAQSHYTENLVLASTLLTYQQRITAEDSPKPREHFGIAPEQHLYLCAQQLRKFHPDFDPMMAGILRNDPQGVVIAVEDRHGHFIAGQLRQRFAATIPDVADRIVFLPFQHESDYRSLTAAADVLLDPLHYGGVNSSYDAFSLSKPIVTLPSRFQRGRYTLACYKKMGLSECVASDPQEYIDIAVALGTDAAYRSEVSQKIRRASPVLFDDIEAVREHERIFNALIEQARRLPRTGRT